MAEEVANSSLVVPQSMLFAILINGVLGFGILIAFLFTAGDLPALIQSNASYPFMDILASSTKSKGAAIVLSSMVAILQACAGVGAISSGSRMLWSFSRERAIPGWRWIRQVCTSSPHVLVSSSDPVPRANTEVRNRSIREPRSRSTAPASS